jgi:Melibiase
MRQWIIIPIILFCAAPAKPQNRDRVSIQHSGWTINADAARGVLTVAHEALGDVLTEVRLNTPSDQGLRVLSPWTAEKATSRMLLVKTVQPRTMWRFELKADSLAVSSTVDEAVLTARAPAPADRLVARLLDTQGFPVSWVGTNEVASGYGGSETRNPSYLPRHNPDVMYFALGPVAGAHLHSLFDRRTDTAIDFPETTSMKRVPGDASRLDIQMPVPGNALIRLLPDYFRKTLGVPYYVPFDDSYFRTAPMVWSSWTSYYDQVKESDIVRNADWLAANLQPYGFQYVQLDDGYDRDVKGQHYWIENWDKAKFPHGPQWLADHIKARGLHPGIWIVPNAYAGAVEQHPDWYLRYRRDGKIVFDYSTPALDSTNPGVLNFLRREFKTLDDWGFEYYKFDGEHAIPRYVPGVDLSRLYDKTVDPLVAYRRRLELIRSTIGPHRFIEGCPAGTPLNGIGYFNSYFNGDDLYNSWQGMYALFSSINANAFLNHLVVYTMPGEGIELNPPMTVEEAEKKRDSHVVETVRTREAPMMGLGTTLNEAHTIVSYVALTGVVYPLASVMPELPEERVRLLKATMPTLPIFPVDLFSRGTDMRWDIFKHTTTDDYIHNYPEILDLKVNSPVGLYDVTALTNWRSWKVTRELSFPRKLGLDDGASYVAFDFWRQEIAGVFKDRMKVEIEPHDTRVFQIYPLLDRPQLVGNSRHITGAYSILEVAWNAGLKRLEGVSQAVAGAPYSLWIYVPDGMTVTQVTARTSDGGSLPEQHGMAGHALKVRFEGQAGPVRWSLDFADQQSALR